MASCTAGGKLSCKHLRRSHSCCELLQHRVHECQLTKGLFNTTRIELWKWNQLLLVTRTRTTKALYFRYRRNHSGMRPSLCRGVRVRVCAVLRTGPMTNATRGNGQVGVPLKRLCGKMTRSVGLMKPQCAFKDGNVYFVYASGSVHRLALLCTPPQGLFGEPFEEKFVVSACQLCPTSSIFWIASCLH